MGRLRAMCRRIEPTVLVTALLGLLGLIDHLLLQRGIDLSTLFPSIG
jgi:hypothetical protein